MLCISMLAVILLGYSGPYAILFCSPCICTKIKSPISLLNLMKLGILLNIYKNIIKYHVLGHQQYAERTSGAFFLLHDGFGCYMSELI